MWSNKEKNEYGGNFFHKRTAKNAFNYAEFFTGPIKMNSFSKMISS